MIGAYAASKFALEGLSDVKRREAAPQGVAVIVVQPDGIRTAMVANQLAAIGGQRDALAPADQVRYAAAHSGIEAAMTRTWTEGSPPEKIAGVTVAALDAMVAQMSADPAAG